MIKKKIAIATDNWPNQIHYFVDDLDQNEINQINKIYARGKYINKCIEEIDKYKKTKTEEIYEKALNANPTGEPSSIISDPKVQADVLRIYNIPDVVINTAIQAANEIKECKGWTGYNKLRQIARLK